MAITGAIFNSLIYGDVNSADYGVYISGDAVFNAPQRAVELVSVPGRNGSIAIDQGHFENIEVEYPAGMFGDDKTDFRQRLSDFRNAIMSQKGYQRLSDTYHPDEYRMGMYIEGLEVEPTHYNEAGRFTLKFNCKPQRYLTSGEQLVDIEEWTDVVTVRNDEGEPVQFDNDNPAKSFKSIEENFLVASQDGTPWKSEVESAPYLFRQSSGGTVDHEYDSESDAIVGGTVAWNQWVGTNRFPSVESSFTDGVKVSAVDTSKGTITIEVDEGGATSSRSFAVMNSSDKSLLESHKYLTVGCPNGGSLNTFFIGISGNPGYGQDTGNGGIIANYKWGYSLSIAIASGCPAGTYVFKPQFIDLTALFGSSTIADYLYSLEQTTAGSGIAKLKEWGFDIDSYHAYDSGSLQSVCTSGHNTYSSNLLGDTGYRGAYAQSDGTSLKISDEVMEHSVDDVGVLSVNVTTAWRGCLYATPVLQSGTYAIPYQEYSSGNTRATIYVTDSDLKVVRTVSNRSYGGIYREVLVEVTSGQRIAYFVGANTTSNVSITNFGLFYESSIGVSYGTYVKHSYPIDDVQLRGIPKLDSSNNLYYDGDVYEPSGSVTRNFGIRAYQSGDESLADAITDGTNTVYKLATPITETADPYTAIQTVDPYGTEEYVDYGVSQGTRDIAVPVGHQTRYIERVPIEGIDSITTYLGHTGSVEDATAYVTEFNGTEYGGMLDVVSGEFTRYFKGITYTGQDIGDTWISDCDPFVEGTLPTYGAQVVYFLSTFETDDFDGHDIDTLVGHNVLWSDPTSIILEAQYGIEPGILYNPTRFDAQPLLAVEGYGDIEFNGYKIELENGGRYEYVTLVEDETKERVGTNNHEEISLTYPLDLRVFNTGDSFWAHIDPRFWFTVSTIDLRDTLVSRSGIIWEDYSFFPFSNGTGILAIPTNRSNGFVKGTSLTYTGDLVLTISGHSGHDFSATVHATVAKIYDADASTLTFTASIDISDVQGTESMQNSRIELDVGAQGFSSMTILGNPTYIDCGLGEAYRYIDGEVVSLNKYIDLGSDLPVLSPGLNEVTYPSSVRGLLIKPNWWKI